MELLDDSKDWNVCEAAFRIRPEQALRKRVFSMKRVGRVGWLLLGNRTGGRTGRGCRRGSGRRCCKIRSVSFTRRDEAAPTRRSRAGWLSWLAPGAAEWCVLMAT